MKKALLYFLALCLFLCSCESGAGNNESATSEKSEVTENSESSQDTSSFEGAERDDIIVIGEKGKKSKFYLVHNIEDPYAQRGVDSIYDSIDDLSRRPPTRVVDTLTLKNANCQIIINSPNRPVCKELMDGLEESEYAIKTYVTESEAGTCKYIVLAYRGYSAALACFEKFVEQCLKGENNVAYVDSNIDIKEKCVLDDVVFETGVENMRDPFILYENGKYYMYGTGWQCRYSDNLKGPWSEPVSVAQIPERAVKQYWAPEVHKYNGAYYMFTTYFSSETNHRGCTIMKADNPLGPFVEITNGHITPSYWDAIDGTLYIDENDQPWMVFVHEWTCMDDEIGSFAAAKLSDDLTEFISEPVELFKADEPNWAISGVTDGCFLYRCEDGSLLMLWSNFSRSGYVTAVARSESGSVLGPWIQDETLLYEKSDAREYDGGHGMIFTAGDGNMYLCLHSPNSDTNKATCSLVVRVEEHLGKIRWNIYN